MTSGLSRTNPQAHRQDNTIQVYGVQKVGGCSFAPAWTAAITSAGATTTFTPTVGYNATGLRYFKWRITDDDGNVAYGAATINSATPVAVTTSGLDPKKNWKVEFSAETKNAGLNCRVSFYHIIPAGMQADNPSFTSADV